MPRTVLFPDPDQHILTALETMFAKDAELAVVTASTVTGALEALQAQHIDLVVAERMLDPERGTELLDEAHLLRPDTPLILLTDLEGDQHGQTTERLGPNLRILQNHGIPNSYGPRCFTVRPTEMIRTPTRGCCMAVSPRSSCDAHNGSSRGWRTRKSLGAVLLELGEITSDDFERVQAIRRANLSLIEILHDDGHVTDEGVASYREAKLANPGCRRPRAAGRCWAGQ